VNPSILAEAGMPVAAVTAATCLSAAFGSLVMGLYARGTPSRWRPAWG
jgi:AGZA family xanthine/uracil permease-like MFS transporter